LLHIEERIGVAIGSSKVFVHLRREFSSAQRLRCAARARATRGCNECDDRRFFIVAHPGRITCPNGKSVSDCVANANANANTDPEPDTNSHTNPHTFTVTYTRASARARTCCQLPASCQFTCNDDITASLGPG
jgi:hypothetical protein